MVLRIVGWQMDLNLILGDLELEQNALHKVIRSCIFKNPKIEDKLTVQRANTQISDDYYLAVNDVTSDGFRMELHRDRLSYHHVLPGDENAVKDLNEHINKIYGPLFKKLLENKTFDLTGRISEAATSTDLHISFPQGSNKQSLIHLLGNGLSLGKKDKLSNAVSLGLPSDVRLDMLNYQICLNKKFKGLPIDICITVACPPLYSPPHPDVEPYINAKVNVRTGNCSGEHLDSGKEVFNKIVRPLISNNKKGGGFLYRLAHYK